MSRGGESPAHAGQAHSASDIDSERARISSRSRALPSIAAIVAIALCIAAGNWQRERLHAKEALRAQYDAAVRAGPVAFASVTADADWAALRYAPVLATGEFLASRQIFIDNKVHAGRAGYDAVTPLVLADGRAVLVDRGWTPQLATRSQLPDVPPPAGVVSVEGRIVLPSSEYIELRHEAPVGAVWQNLDPARYAAATGLRVLPVVIEATAGPAADDGLIREWPLPDFGAERHRIYMIQWYTFAAVIAALWLWFNRPRPRARGDG